MSLDPIISAILPNFEVHDDRGCSISVRSRPNSRSDPESLLKMFVKLNKI